MHNYIKNTAGGGILPTLAALLFFTFLAAPPLAAGTEPTKFDLKTSQKEIGIDFFYHGSQLTVTGSVDEAADVIVSITRPPAKQTLKRKGKVAGFLWMNVGDLTFDHIPGLYILRTSAELNDLLPETTRTALGLGYEALERNVVIEPLENPSERSDWFKQYTRLRENEKLYSLSGEGWEFQPAKNGMKRFTLTVHWPYQATPGEYVLNAFAIRDGSVVDRSESTITVDQVGIVKILSALAKNNAALYGLISVSVALIVGLGVGIIFKRGGNK